MSFFRKLNKGLKTYKNIKKYTDKVSKQNKRKQKKPVQTYVIYDGFKYKIGKSNDPERRINELTKNSSVFELEVITIFPYNIEKELHNYFESYRDNGEWFSLNETNIKFIKYLSGLSEIEAKKNII